MAATPKPIRKEAKKIQTERKKKPFINTSKEQAKASLKSDKKPERKKILKSIASEKLKDKKKYG